MTTLAAKLQLFSATETNLAKLDALWRQIEGLVPSGPAFGSTPEYEELCLAFRRILSSLPAIDKFRIEDQLYDHDAAGQMHLDALELDDFAVRVQVEKDLSAQGRQLQEYRLRLQTKRRELVRPRLLTLMNEIDQTLSNLSSVVVGLEISTALTDPLWGRLKEAVTELDTLLGTTARPQRWSDLKRHLHFGKVGDLSDIIRIDWPKVGSLIRAQLYGAHDPVPVEAEDLGMSTEQKQSDHQPIEVFISHATADESLAAALVDLFQSALALPAAAIRCTSVTGYCLRGGADVDERLRREVGDANAFIGIISHHSLRSPYVLFELGARWGANLHLIPVLAPGLGPDVLIGPLSGLHALKTDRDGLTQLVEDLGSELNLDQTAPTTYQRQINRVLDVPPAAPPDTPMTHGEDRTHALSPEAQDLLVTAASDRQNGAIFATQSFAGLSISVGDRLFTEVGNARSEAKWKRAIEALSQAGFIEYPDGDGSLRKVTAAGFEMVDTLRGTDQATPAPHVPPPTPPDLPGTDGILHYPAHWYAAPLPGDENLIDVRRVESAAELDALKASNPMRTWWDTPEQWPGIGTAAIRRVDGRRYSPE